jgi:hypothetical protein
MSSLFYNSVTGKLYRNAGGGLIADDLATLQDCCCVLILDCILERQKAADISSGSWIDPDSSYTLTQLKSAVNQMAPDFLDGTWTAGGTTDPPLLPSTYANSATDEAELRALVVDMLTTVVVAKGKDRYNYQGNATGELSAQAAFDAADADYTESSSSSGPQGTLSVWSWAKTTGSDEDWNCDVSTQKMTPYIDGVYTGLSKTARLALRSETYGAYSLFNKQGRTMADDHNWWIEDSVSMGAAASTDFSDFSGSGAPVNYDTSDPHEYGYQVSTTSWVKVLLDWDFACV